MVNFDPRSLYTRKTRWYALNTRLGGHPEPVRMFWRRYKPLAQWGFFFCSVFLLYPYFFVLTVLAFCLLSFTVPRPHHTNIHCHCTLCFITTCFFAFIVLHFVVCLYFQHTSPTSMPSEGFEPPTVQPAAVRTTILRFRVCRINMHKSNAKRGLCLYDSKM